jgi:2-polyprenyl-3-methyl-5-hydroxy-6-metoxy-1,4-benzoquinol methylase
MSSELERLARLGWRPDTLGPLVDGVRFVSERIEVDYPEVGLRALGLDGGKSYWFDHRAHEVIHALGTVTRVRTVWDVGAGTGSMSTRLARAGHDVVAVEPLPEGARAIARQGCSAVFCASLEQLRLPSGCLRVIGLFDVLEHIPNPRHLMIEIHRVLEPGGVLVLTVPALQALWSDDDEAAGHHRRYRQKELDEFIDSCGFDRAMSRYLFATLVVPAAVMRAVPYRFGRRRTTNEVIAATSKQLSPGRVVDRVIRGVLQAERFTAKRIRLPVGLSLFGIYRRSMGDHQR